jgi:hypothetical protein
MLRSDPASWSVGVRFAGKVLREAALATYARTPEQAAEGQPLSVPGTVKADALEEATVGAVEVDDPDDEPHAAKAIMRSEMDTPLRILRCRFNVIVPASLVRLALSRMVDYLKGGQAKR